jgi:orotidine-5'-phosphate decarboxylase
MAELILALDLPTGSAAFQMLERLPAVRWVKIGSILMTREGPAVVRDLVDRGLSVFLDLKWHDIPNTVFGAVAQARELGVRMATVHTLGGAEMMAAAADAAGTDVDLLGVTVLTSHTPQSYGAALGRPEPMLTEEAVRQARNAVAAGLAGVVSAPLEAEAVRAALGPGPSLVVPGIRPPGAAPDDQRRTARPSEAVRAGATHLVVGRPVLQATYPERTWALLAAEAACGA